MFVCLLAAGASLGQGSNAPATPKSEADPVVIKYGTQQVRKSELEQAMKSIPDEYQAYVAGPGKRAFAEDYLRMKMLSNEAVKNGLDKDADVRAQLQLMRDNTLASAQLERMQAGVKIADADLQKAYDARKNEMDQAKARHILIAFKGSRAAQEGKPELTEEQAKAKADDLRAKIVAGADFAELAKKESDDVGSGQRGGDLGAFGRGQMVPEFENAVFNAKAGEIVPVVRTQFGYHIIQVQERNARPLAEVREGLEKELTQARVQEMLDGMKKAANATFDETYFAPPVAEAPPAQPAAEAKPQAQQQPK
jgi:peptidyl-prolyl cis-trans isomerase C